MAKEQYDVAIIGAGPGGYVAAIRSAQLGFKTVCIDKRETLGGTCLNVGCIPSKALLQSTENYSFLIHSGEEHGIEYEKLTVNFPQMMQRKDQVVKSLVDGVAGLLKRNKVAAVRGLAKFLSPHTVEVVNGSEKKEIEAKYFILATGSEPTALPFLPFDEKVVVSSTGALSLPSIPKKMLVIGGGVIGVELASVYNRLGAEVTIVEMLDQICIAMDPAVSKSLLQILKKQGVRFFLGTKVTAAEINAEGVLIKVSENNKEAQLSADVALVAVGRRPYSKQLGLKEIGIEIDSRGFVPVDRRFRTVLPHIFAIGDLVDGAMLAHRASEEGIAVAEIIAGQTPRIDYLAIPNVIYTHPEAAAVGLTEKEALELGLEVSLGIAFFKGNARARCSGDTDGFVKIIGEKGSGRLIGMHIIGPHASEMIGEGVAAISKRYTVEELANISHAHPTLSESIKDAAFHALGRPIN